MRIQHNILAMNSYRNYTNNVSALGKNLEKLSSGYKINRAGDDAAGLAISEKMRSQITGLQAAQKNVKDGTSLIKTAEGAMQEVQDMLKRMTYLAEQSANGTYDDNIDRANLQKEVNSLKSEINRIADSANFNGIKLLDGTQSGLKTISFSQAADTASKASVSFELSSTLTGKMLMGGSISLGAKSWDVKLAGEINGVTKTAEYNATDNVIYVDTDTDAATIASFIVDAANNGTNGIEVKFSDLDGNKHSTKATITDAGNGKIKIEAGKDGKIDVTTIPTMSVNAGLQLQIGDTSQSFNQMKIGVNDIHTSNLFMGYNVDISDQEGAADAINYIKNATNMVSSTRGDLGALQNRLDHTLNNLSVMTENIQDAESSIRDTDVADEMMAYTKNNILIQSAQAMLAQANAVPQGVLQLLQ